MPILNLASSFFHPGRDLLRIAAQANDSLRQLRQNYRHARDELSALRTSSCADAAGAFSSAAAAEFSVVEADLRAELAAAVRDVERAKSDAAAAELARVTFEGTIYEAKAEAASKARALEAAEAAALRSAECAAEAECESRELRSHLAVTREKMANMEVAARSRDALMPAIAASLPMIAPAAPAATEASVKPDAKLEAERHELRTRVAELERLLETQKATRDKAQTILESQVERRVALAREEAVQGAVERVSGAPRTVRIDATPTTNAGAGGAVDTVITESLGRSASGSVASRWPPSPGQPVTSGSAVAKAAEAKAVAETKMAVELVAKAQVGNRAREEQQVAERATAAAAPVEAAEVVAREAAQKRATEAAQERATEEARVVTRTDLEEKETRTRAEAARAAEAARVAEVAQLAAAAAASDPAEAQEATAEEAMTESKVKVKADAHAAEEAQPAEDRSWEVAAEEASAAKPAAAEVAAAKVASAGKSAAPPRGSSSTENIKNKIGGASTGRVSGPAGEFLWSGSDGTVHCAFAGCTHIGGTGPAEGGPRHNNPAKKNQDAYFITQPNEESVVWGILDGHGPDNGVLVAESAASALCEWFEAHVGELKPEKAQVCTFSAARPFSCMPPPPLQSFSSSP